MQDNTSVDKYADLRVVGIRVAAEITDLAPATLSRMRSEGSGPQVTQLSPGRYGYRLADLRAWLESRRVSA